MRRSHALLIAAVMLVASLLINGCPRGNSPDANVTPPTGPETGGAPDAGTDTDPVVEAVEPAPDLKFTSIDGKELSLRDSRGEVVVLYFWATYCSGCIEKLPKIQAIAEAYRDKSVTIWALSRDPNEAMVEGWLEQNDLGIPVALVDDDASQALFPGQMPLAIPRTVVIDQNSDIIAKMDPDTTVEQMEEEIKGLLE
jgi:peroxiredoxin